MPKTLPHAERNISWSKAEPNAHFVDETIVVLEVRARILAHVIPGHEVRGPQEFARHGETSRQIGMTAGDIRQSGRSGIADVRVEAPPPQTRVPVARKRVRLVRRQKQAISRNDHAAATGESDAVPKGS